MKINNGIAFSINCSQTRHKQLTYPYRNSTRDNTKYETKIISSSKLVPESYVKPINNMNNKSQLIQTVNGQHFYINSNNLQLNYKKPVYHNLNTIKIQKVGIQSPVNQKQIYRNAKSSSKILKSAETDRNFDQRRKIGTIQKQNAKLYNRKKENFPIPGLQTIQKVTSLLKKINIAALYTSLQDVYEGQLNQKQLFHGNGLYFFNQCNVQYRGQFHNGQIHGYGKITYQHANQNLFWLIYQGNFENSKKNGKGKFFYGDQNHYYDGDWKNDAKQGKGVYHSNQQSYDGYWAKNKKHGEGHLLNRKNNSQFKGNFYDDHFIEGNIQYSNGDSYNGNFHLGKKEGYGSYAYHSRKEQYNGQFSNDLRHGKGKIQFSNGDQFAGSFRHGKIDEQMNCTYKWTDGSVFNGWFKNGNPDKGTVKNNTQKEYQYTLTNAYNTY